MLPVNVPIPQGQGKCCFLGMASYLFQPVLDIEAVNPLKIFKLRESSVPLRAITMLAIRKSIVPVRGCLVRKLPNAV